MQASKVSATAIGLDENINFVNAKLVDHLTAPGCKNSMWMQWLSTMNVTLHSVGWRVDLSFSACLPIPALTGLGTSRLYFWSSLQFMYEWLFVNIIFAMSSLTQAMQNKNLLRELPYSGHNIILCAMGNSTTSSRLIISQLKSIWNVSLAFMTFFLTLTLNWHLSFPFEHTEIY